MFAGKTAINNIIIPQAANFLVEGNNSNKPRPISQTPLITTNS